MEKALLVCDFCNGDHRVAVNRYPREGVIPGRGGPTKFIDVCATHDKLMQAGMSALYKSIAGKALPRGKAGSPRPRKSSVNKLYRPTGENWKKIEKQLLLTPGLTVLELAAKTKIDKDIIQENLWRAKQFKMTTHNGVRPYRHELSVAPQ